MPLVLTVNGQTHAVECGPDDRLLDVLRDRLGLTGAKPACRIGVCGACTVLVDGRPVRSCRVAVREVVGREVLTIEGLGSPDRLHPLQQAFLDHHAVQCGYCTPGMVLAAKALLDQQAHPSREDIRRALAGHLCRCTGYQQIIDAIQSVAEGRTASRSGGSGVGASAARVDAIGKLTGQTRYTADIAMPGALVGRVLRSRHAHAEIVGIDTRAAEAVPGVVAVLTHRHVPGDKHFGKALKDQPVLAFDKVRYVGDAVALVLAENEQAAQAGLEAIRVEYRVLPGVFTAEEAMAPGAPAVHAAGNVLYHFPLRKGDVATGFGQADIIVEQVYRTAQVEHACLETEAAIAYVDGEGVLTVLSPSQNVFFDRAEIARCLDLSPRQVRVVQQPMGGAFGKREDIYCQILAGLGAWHTRRPVRIVLSRPESFTVTSKRHPMTIRYRTGARRDGRLTAVEVEILADTGAYASWAPNIVRKAAVHATGPYAVPHVKVDAYAVYTNRALSGAMRGFGATQVAIAYESQMNALARRLGLDPFEIRRRNALRGGSATATGQVLEASVGLMETLDRAQEAASGLPPLPTPAGWRRGRGVASCLYGIGYGAGISDVSNAEIVLERDGRFHLFVGTVDYGQGSSTVFCQMAATELNSDLAHIVITSGDSGQTPNSGSTVASRQTFTTGNAVRAAAAQMAQRVSQAAADRFGGLPHQWTLGPGQVTGPAGSRSLAELAGALAETGEKPLRTRGRWAAQTEELAPATGQGRAYATYAFGTQVADVLVDPQTGRVRVERVVAAHDVGKAINPAATQGQIIGGVAMGVGMALWEEYVTEAGIPRTTNLDTYRVPRSTEMPEVIPIIVESPEPAGPYGAKGVGEPALLPTVPAILAAIADAVGVQMTQTPVTADRLKQALLSRP